MANWDILKRAISDVVKANGNQEITGQLLQQVLLNIVTNVGANATFGGIATSATNPGTPDGPIFYIASAEGEPKYFANFGLTVVKNELAIFNWQNGNWNKTSMYIFPVSVIDTSNADLDFADEQGNVIMRLENGHILVKNFNSSNVLSQHLELRTEHDDEELRLFLISRNSENEELGFGPFSLPYATESSEGTMSAEDKRHLEQSKFADTSNADLDFADEQGNVIMRLENGEIQVKNFYSGNTPKQIDDNSSAEFQIADEQGNVILQLSGGHIKVKNFDSRNEGVKGYKYVGEKIDVKSYQYAKELLFTESNSSSSSRQGAACFGKYLFQFHNTNDTIDVFNLEKKSFIQTIRLTAVSTYHCNNANFGNEYHTQGDEFPLLYVSQENVAEHKCLVYRITGTEGSWNVMLVQTITFPTPSDDFMWYPNCIIDTQNSKLIAAGLGNNPWSSGVDNIIRYKVFSLPKLNEGNVTLSLSDIEDSIEVKPYSTCQGGFILNNKIYQVFGMSYNAQLNVIDLATHRVISKINITGDGINVEPESCFLYDDFICINFFNGQIIKFNF